MIESALNEKFLAACENGKTGLVSFAIELGVDIHQDNDKAFSLACYNGSIEVIELLISHGVNPNTENSLGFISACSSAEIRVLEYFINEHGFNPNEIAKDILDTAVDSKAVKVIKFLCDPSKTINFIDIHKDNDFLFHKAVKEAVRGNNEVFNYLMYDSSDFTDEYIKKEIMPSLNADEKSVIKNALELRDENQELSEIVCQTPAPKQKTLCA